MSLITRGKNRGWSESPFVAQPPAGMTSFGECIGPGTVSEAVTDLTRSVDSGKILPLLSLSAKKELLAAIRSVNAGKVTRSQCHSFLFD